MKTIIRMIPIIFLLCAVFPIQSRALSCEEVKEPVIDHYDLAVAGTVLEVSKNKVMIEVEQSWKREVSSPLIFHTDLTWGFGFEKDRHYLIYLDERNGDYDNSPCSPVERGDAPERLGNMEPMSPEEDGNAGLKMWMLFRIEKIVLFGVLLIVTLGIIILYSYRKRIQLKG
ncbi:hypothetical protein SAMN04487944_1325 [Gracilibacillus ureilyticus]|uniref:Tissue inhibitor of metalloproteinase n=1 Tax=Gracilibacillus ureilyticus TaxID=531814 RepID=A0A1H9W294_9BACI|nr:hypothetical protein [Gracilibacillus ureilyticus]SES27633.1 hypothetical protein SAMN04487944_1325 [Gracilibacillus ureilyticus]